MLPVLLYRWLRYGYLYRRIPLTKGMYAIVDPDMFWRLIEYQWSAVGCQGLFYARRPNKCGKGKIYMHRWIADARKGEIIDHINHNGLDNRAANLRPTTTSQNAWNSRKQRNSCSSKYKGVSWGKDRRIWAASITFERRKIFLGNFENEIDAARAYDEAAKKYHGEFAVLNFPVEKTRWHRLRILFGRIKDCFRYAAKLIQTQLIIRLRN